MLSFGLFAPKGKNLIAVATDLIYQIVFQLLHFNIYAYADAWVFLTQTIPEVLRTNEIPSSLLNPGSLKFFSKNLQAALFSAFYYKAELRFLSGLPKSAQMPLITESANYIRERSPTSSIQDWSLFFFLTLLDRKKERVFLKHLIFNQGYLLTFNWLSLAHQIGVFGSKM